MTDDLDQLLLELQRQADRRRDAREIAREAMTEIARILPAILDAGVTKREIARRTGLSRVTIDNLLRQRDQPESD